MPRQLSSCITLPKRNSLQYPSIWAGYQNEWKFREDLSDEFINSKKNKKYKKWKKQNVFNCKHGLLSLLYEGSKITTEKDIQYGYFETCLRASDSNLQSMFSLESSLDCNIKIVIFSYCARSRERVEMDAISFNEKSKRSNNNSPSSSSNSNISKYNYHPLRKEIFAMPQTPVIVGIDWTPENITTYVDGHVIRQLENKYWHSPMHICFSLNSIDNNCKKQNSKYLNLNWKQKNSDQVFEIYYLRCWNRYPDHRKLNTPGLDNSPTHHLKVTSSSTHRSVHYRKSRENLMKI